MEKLVFFVLICSSNFDNFSCAISISVWSWTHNCLFRSIRRLDLLVRLNIDSQRVKRTFDKHKKIGSSDMKCFCLTSSLMNYLIEFKEKFDTFFEDFLRRNIENAQSIDKSQLNLERWNQISMPVQSDMQRPIIKSINSIEWCIWNLRFCSSSISIQYLVIPISFSIVQYPYSST